jgi:hypothetical protein
MFITRVFGRVRTQQAKVRKVISVRKVLKDRADLEEIREILETLDPAGIQEKLEHKALLGFAELKAIKENRDLQALMVPLVNKDRKANKDHVD